MKKPNLTQSRKNILWAIFFGVMAVICFINFRTMWKTGLISIAISVTFVYLYNVHKKKETELDKLMETMKDFLEEDDEEEESNAKKLLKKVQNNRQLLKEDNKEIYENYIKQVNKDFDFDISEYDDTGDYEDDE